jgi:predicted TIM-barrel fold metal-dependent hydrolase
MDDQKIWAHSGDSHFLEPDGLWEQVLPANLAARMPRSELVSDNEEIVHVDGKSFRRALPTFVRQLNKLRDPETGMNTLELSARPPGSRGDIKARLADLDQEGVWAEVMYASLGLWENLIEDRSLVRIAAAAENEWKAEYFQGAAPDRLIPTASLPLLDVDDAVAELQHAAELGLHLVAIPTEAPEGMPDWNRDEWEPLWAAAEEAGMVIGVHIGTENFGGGRLASGPGALVINYSATTFTAQKLVLKLVGCGALDRHPGLRLLISEGGVTWVPFMGDRMNEGYRQQHMFVKPVLSKLPKEILFNQVYASFQHDECAPAANWAMRYQNAVWGSDYPHMEGTYGHTQKTLHELFDHLDPEVSHRIRIGALKELFPHISDPPGS